MILEIAKILQLKRSHNEGQNYIRITFKDIKTGMWYKTDLVPGFRNYYRWRKLLRKGNTIGNLKLKDGYTVDADSMPMLIQGRKRLKTQRWPGNVEELAKLGVF